MRTFIRVVELWVPDRTRTRLEFGGGLCGGKFSEFQALSENTLFAYDKTAVDQIWVVALLSAQATPIGQRFEIWVPNAARDALVFQSGDCSRRTDLDALYRSRTIGRGEGSIGGAWATGMPAISEDLKHDASIAASLARGSGMKQIIILPVIDNALLKAVLAWYL